MKRLNRSKLPLFEGYVKVYEEYLTDEEYKEMFRERHRECVEIARIYSSDIQELAKDYDQKIRALTSEYDIKDYVRNHTEYEFRPYKEDLLGDSVMHGGIYGWFLEGVVVLHNGEDYTGEYFSENYIDPEVYIHNVRMFELLAGYYLQLFGDDNGYKTIIRCMAVALYCNQRDQVWKVGYTDPKGNLVW